MVQSGSFIHEPAEIRRYLEVAAFSIEEIIERGALQQQPAATSDTNNNLVVVVCVV